LGTTFFTSLAHLASRFFSAGSIILWRGFNSAPLMQESFGCFSSMTCARIAESNNVADRTLYTRAKADQLLNIWVLVPLLFLLNLGCAFSIWNWPDLFIARAGHICLISIQLASFIGYLLYIGHYFKAIAPLLLRSREGAGEQS
jgi:hypothetical protein